MLRSFLLLSSIFISIDSTCFESITSRIPRIFIGIETGIWTEAGCRFLCFNNTQCLAVQYRSSTKNCQLLGEEVDGSECGTVYSLFAKRDICDYPIPERDPLIGFSSVGCQDADDIVDISLGMTPSCPGGMTPSGKQPFIVDVVNFDGTRDFYPPQRSILQWDSDVGSFRLLYNDLVIFVSYARCSRAPSNPSSSCTCASVPPTGPQGSQTDQLSPFLNILPSCPLDYNLWVYLLFESGSQPIQTASIKYRKVFCGMSTWFMWYIRDFEDVYRISQASCLRVPPG